MSPVDFELAQTVRSSVELADDLGRTSEVPPPLRGDGTGKFRVYIVGNSGIPIHSSSTVARELSKILRLPYISLDNLYWKPGWGQPSTDEFRASVRAALDMDPRGWIVDGRYEKKLGGMVSSEATDVIWLDPPLLLYFPRLCWRTFLRLLRLEPPCSPGCEERLREVFSREGIIWWSLSNHWAVRKREEELCRSDGVHVGGKRRRIGGWGRELAAWKRDVQAMLLPARQYAALPSAS
ncbi:hypothetical protein BD414DRAFT_458308 [Trametes punicea]|nr:hypothetical protein BD414DRAFT_458308 [Trametes punicea]